MAKKTRQKGSAAPLSLGEAVRAAMDAAPVDDRPIGWKLNELALDFKNAAGASGDAYERATAVVLAALDCLARHRDDLARTELEAAAERFFKRNPDGHPFTATAAAGADHLLERIREARAAGRSNVEIALIVISEAPKARPGLPAIAKHEALRTAQRKAYAADLMARLVRALDAMDRREKLASVDDWAAAALRAVLRVLGDADADNALKHRQPRRRK